MKSERGNISSMRSATVWYYFLLIFECHTNMIIQPLTKQSRGNVTYLLIYLTIYLPIFYLLYYYHYYCLLPSLSDRADDDCISLS